MDHPLRCECGTVEGHVRHAASACRVVCYCRDCQAYAHATGNPARILDPLGGSEVVATLQQHVTFAKGVDALACMSLSERGLLRWYARCCDTPIGNMMRDRRVAFVGLLHTCLSPAPGAIDAAFGTARMHVKTDCAKGKVERSLSPSIILSGARFFGAVLKTRVDGAYRRSPFFLPDGRPIAPPRVLDAAERENAMRAVNDA